MVPELKPDQLEAFQFNRSDLGTVLDGQTFPDLEFVIVEKLLDMGKPAMEDRGEGPEHLFEIVFQLAAGEEADSGVEKCRHGELDLVRLGQGAMIGLAGSWCCAMKCEVVEDGGGYAGFLGDVCLMGHCLVPLIDLTRFGWGDNRTGGDRAASVRIGAQRRMRPGPENCSREE